MVIKAVDSWHGKAHRCAEVISGRDVHELIAQTGREKLDELVRLFQQGGIRIGAKVLSGTAFLEIIREVLVEKRDS